MENVSGALLVTFRQTTVILIPLPAIPVKHKLKRNQNQQNLIQFPIQHSITEKPITERKDPISYSHEEYAFTFSEDRKITSYTKNKKPRNNSPKDAVFLSMHLPT